MKRPVRILILGAGAVGPPLAAKLSRVADVVAITREHYATEISQNGLEIHGAWGDESCRSPCVSTLEEDEPFDYVLVTAKSQDTHRTLTAFAGSIRT